MSISNTTVKQLYVGNGANTSFTIPFAYQETDEVVVYLRDESVSPATETLLVETTDYTLTTIVSGLPTIVEMNVAPTASQKLLIKRVTDKTQESDYVNNGVFPGNSLETDFDKLIQLVQELGEEQGSSLLLPVTSSLSNLRLPEPEADKVLGWNASADGLENKTQVDTTSLQTQITNNSNNIATNTSNIATNTTDIATNTSNIATNTADIATNTSNIGTNTTNINANSVAIGNLQTTVGGLSDQSAAVAQNTSDIADNALDISQNAANIASNDTDIGSLNTRVSALESVASGLRVAGKKVLPNNQSVAADITGLSLDADGAFSAVVQFEIYRKTDSKELRTAGLLQLTYLGSTWYVERIHTMAPTGVLADDNSPDGVTFSVVTDGGTKEGQVQAVTDNMAGANYEGYVTYRINELANSLS